MLYNINALNRMYEELKEQYPGQIEYILTYRLNQDCLEQFFSVLRAMGGSYTKFGALEGFRRIRSYLLGAGGTLTVKAANVKPTEVSKFSVESLVEKADFTIPSVLDPDLEVTDEQREEVLITLNVDVVAQSEPEKLPFNADEEFDKLLGDFESSKDVCFRGSDEPELDASDEEDLDDEELFEDITEMLGDFGMSKEIKEPKKKGD